MVETVHNTVNIVLVASCIVTVGPLINEFNMLSGPLMSGYNDSTSKRILIGISSEFSAGLTILHR